MDVKKFISFLGKYASEASGIAAAFRTILPALPIGVADREKVTDFLARLESIPASIEASIRDLTKAPAVVIKKTDIEAAVKAHLPGIVKAELDKMGDAATLKAAVESAVADALAKATKDKPETGA